MSHLRVNDAVGRPGVLHLHTGGRQEPSNTDFSLSLPPVCQCWDPTGIPQGSVPCLFHILITVNTTRLLPAETVTHDGSQVDLWVLAV